MDNGWYYLHTNDDLIYKRFRPDDSDFVRKIWQLNINDRGTAWLIAIEAKALGARESRINALADLWGLTDEDAHEFVANTGGNFQLFRDGVQWCATFGDFINLQESQAGFGDTALEGFAELAKPGLVGASR